MASRRRDYRMRNATILVLRLKGVATEAIKNIVLAGIGTLIVLDTEDVSSEDLGAGFFFRDEDVGKKVRVAAPLLRLRRRRFSYRVPSRFLSFLRCSGVVASYLATATPQSPCTPVRKAVRRPSATMLPELRFAMVPWIFFGAWARAKAYSALLRRAHMLATSFSLGDEFVSYNSHMTSSFLDRELMPQKPELRVSIRL